VLGPGRSMRQVPCVGQIRVGELKIDICRLRRRQPCAAQLLNLVDAITRRIEPFPIGGTDSTNESVGCPAEAIAVASRESGVPLFIEAALLLPDMAAPVLLGAPRRLRLRLRRRPSRLAP